MKRLIALAPPTVLENPKAHQTLAPAMLACYQVLWHPSLLNDAESLPSWGDPSNPPNASVDGEMILTIPKSLHESLSEITKKDLAESPGSLLIAEERHCSVDGPSRLLEALNLTAGDPEQLLDFFALGYAHWGLELVAKAMGHANPLEPNSFFEEVRKAAEAFIQQDHATTEEYVRVAFEHLQSSRSSLYPATIHLLDIALAPTDLTIEAVRQRLDAGGAVNLILTANEIERLAREREGLIDLLRDGDVEILGGPLDDVPLSLLPAESRRWRLARSAEICEARLGRSPEGFGSRMLALVPDLPRLLMKFEYRHALHLAFDGGRFPQFREPKIHWTSPDGSVMESLARAPINAGDPTAVFAVFDELGRSLMHDRSATLVLAQWLGPAAPWRDWFARVQRRAAVFGKFERLGDYFMHSSMPEGSTTTRIDEYHSPTLSNAVLKETTDPISQWTERIRGRAKLDATRSLVALGMIATGEAMDVSTDLEDDFESLPNDFEARHRFAARLATIESSAMEQLANSLLAGAAPGEGVLLVNPASGTRRACVEIDAKSIALEAPVRAVQSVGDKTAVVVDVPGWGYAWLVKGNATTPPSTRQPPLASGRRLRNEYIEAEIDAKTGGLRGLWRARTGYSRIGQQLIHSKGGAAVCSKVEVTANGPAFGEIVTNGRIVGNGKPLAEFRQAFRLWLGKPVVEMSIQLRPLAGPTGSADEDYFASRWAMPDEKTLVVPSSGFLSQPSRAADLEAGELLSLRERNLVTDLLTDGLPFHKRTGPRLVDTLLVVRGESRVDFRLAIALDLAHPWSSVHDQLWPLGIVKTTKGPPAKGRSGWFANVRDSNLVASALEVVSAEDQTIRVRLIESAGQSTRGGLRFVRKPISAKLTNFRNGLIFDLYPNEEQLPVDCSPHEMLQIEMKF